MKVIETGFEGLKLIELNLYRDERGFFVERFQERRMRELGILTHFVQDNHSRSCARVIRGLHFQKGSAKGPGQGKLVGVTRGRVFDVALDVRPESKTFKKHFSIELSDQNGLLLWIPPGFAHGFQVLGEEEADVFYKVDTYYDPNLEVGIHCLDPELQIKWPLVLAGEVPVISKKDQGLPTWSQVIG